MGQTEVNRAESGPWWVEGSEPLVGIEVMARSSAPGGSRFRQDRWLGRRRMRRGQDHCSDTFHLGLAGPGSVVEAATT